jgi:prepilin-type N-terminal cleavage/methylation domain-containing protein
MRSYTRQSVIVASAIQVSTEKVQVKKPAGFTLVEIMVVVVLIGLLAAIALPAFKRVQTKSRATVIVNNLRQFASAFEQYATQNGAWPPDSLATVIPPGMDNALPIAWTLPFEKGYQYDWDTNVNGISASVSIELNGGDVNDPVLQMVDQIIDDGNTATGSFRWVNDRYMYILQN